MIKTTDIKKVFDAYEKELSLVEAKLEGLFQSEAPLIPLIGKYLLESGGKRLRPLFLLSSARLAGYKGDEHIALAGIIELIHMASLLHDDVVDAAKIRRGRPAAHSVWGNQIVILVGDFLYSNALRKAVSFKDQRIMEALSEATTSMTEGEILQLQKTADINITEDEYIKIISAKTGLLISAACRIGAILSSELLGAEENAFAMFGLKAGTAFQMADDILDYMAEESELGKKLGKDIGEGKITLPVIYLLKNASADEKEEIKRIIEKPSEEGLRRILVLFRQYSVLKESLKRAQALVDEAKDELSIFPDSPDRDAMLSLADYAISRDK
ncbi:MAG: polyprenyl synthetase family protein [Nitrospirae bacterium]|nr:polyprenyl synthetase family protein [Nitrospirota bacterium]MBI3377122.1 polyprenyl synthetase family protein [Nitrospirota bacterium]